MRPTRDNPCHNAAFHWWKMFNPRQLLVHAALLDDLHAHDIAASEFVLGAFQQYLRNQNMFTIWNRQADQLEPMFSNNNYHPKSTMVEGVCLAVLAGQLGIAIWEPVWRYRLVQEPSRDCSQRQSDLGLNGLLQGNVTARAKAPCGDPVLNGSVLSCGSSTELTAIEAGSCDMVITDPPFGDNVQYSELADFFYVWLRLALKDRYPDYFTAEYTPKTLEAVANKARQDDPDAFYQRLLTECWREAHRILKPGGLLAFTFHHSEDAPWVSVLESLFDAGFYLQATYPIRGDESKGDRAFGSQKIEYDIIHVCRKAPRSRRTSPAPAPPDSERRP